MSERAHKTPESARTLPVHEPAAAESRFVQAGALKLHYLDYGTAGRPPMLCVHGGSAHAHWYDFAAPGFLRDYHVLALDLRGHGESDWVDPPAYAYTDYAEDLAAFVEALDLRDFVLVGHSMGGMVSLVYAATHPGRARSLIVVDSTMHMPADRVEAMREFGQRPGRSYATKQALVQRYRLEPAGTMMAAPEVVRHIAERSAREDADGRWRHKFDRRVYAVFQRLDGIPYWARIKVPALYVRGERSTRVTPEILARVQERAPQVEFAEIPASDHHIMLDNAPGFVSAVRAFLSRSDIADAAVRGAG
jgi:pimeloyl-ACP methyl ester carboxylesterase